MGNKLIVMFRKFQLLFAALLMLLGVAAMAGPVRASSGISVASNPVEGSPYEVQENQNSTLTYKITYSVGQNSEGTTPSVSSITVTFTVNNGGTIAESGSSSWTETLTQNLTSPMNVSCEASGPANGNYSVTCQATLNLSDGTAYTSNTASDTFLVAQMTVNVSGPPYVIIDNSDPYDNSPVISTYTASVQGAPDPSNIVYEWTVSSNINDLSTLSDAPNTLPVDGAGPEGAGNITCAAYSDGSNQSGSKQVTVQDEYVVTEDPGFTLVDEGGYLGAFGGFGNPANAPGAVVWNALVGQTDSNTYSSSEGFTVGASVPVEDIAEAKFDLSAATSYSGTYSITFNSSFSFTVQPGQTVTVIGYLIYDQYTGTYQVWGTSVTLQVILQKSDNCIA